MIGVAIIGCGSIGEIHAQCLQSVEGARLGAFCDAFEQRAQELSRKFQGSYATTDPARIFSDDSIDAVYICTHHDTHSLLAIQAAQAGKHVMMEKPLALTLDECYRVGNAVEKSGISLMTGFKMRYYPSVARVKQFIPNPIITVAQMMDGHWPSDFWANDPIKGGGNVLSQGCHTMDLVYYLNESEPERIYAEGDNFTHDGVKIIDNIVATIRFANGRVASVVQGDSGQTPFVSKFSFQVMDGMRTAHLHDRMKTATLFDGEKVVEHTDPEEYGFQEENRDFIRALQMNQKPPITHRDGLRATLLILKAFESIRTGLPQDVRF
ncbi:MAG: Gfo/Idh/MocA family oxidoreductase [Ignavibacteriales bacterium]|nr:Gfo/Idh/MocA family oxidoreductase [Ignavibacteriales bacterium]